MNISDEDREKICEWAAKHPEIKRVYLYGSRARGDNKPDSDIDLAIMMNPAQLESAFTRWLFWHEGYKKTQTWCLSIRSIFNGMKKTQGWNVSALASKEME